MIIPSDFLKNCAIFGVPTFGGGGGGTVTSVSGTTDRITSTGGTTPVIDIAPTYAGQSSISILGTISTGVWNGTAIPVANGGTGAPSAATALSNLAAAGTTINNTFTVAQRFAFSTLTDAATVAVDLAASNNYNLVLGGNRTLGVPTNAVAGQSGVISVRQDITGSRTLSYAWPYMFVGGGAPILSTGKLVLDQLMYMVNSYSTATVTITIAAPGVVTWTGHGLSSGQRIQLTTTGALPTGLTASTTYWVTVINANTFNLSTSFANAQAATFITTTGSQSGVQTATNFSITLTINPAVG